MHYSQTRLYAILSAVALSFLLTSTAFANASSPIIETISFPNRVPLGQSGQGQIAYSASEPVSHLELAVVDGRYMRHDFEVQSTNGSYAFSLDCTDYAQRVVLKATLWTQAGQHSEPQLVQFNCGQPPRYDFTQQQASSQPMGLYMKLNLFIVEDHITTLTQGAQTGTSTWWSAPAPEVIAALEQTIVPALNGIWDQCNVGFELGTARVVHPENIELSQGSFEQMLFTQNQNDRYIQHGSRTGMILKMAREAVAEKLAQEGQQITGEDLFVFVVGSRIFTTNNGKKQDVEGFGEIRQPTYSIVRWGSIYQNQNEFVLPRQFISSLAHELGHNMGLYHPGSDGLNTTASDANNLMKGSGVAPEPRANLVQAQCELVSDQIASLSTQVANNPNNDPATDPSVGINSDSLKKSFYPFLMLFAILLWAVQVKPQTLKR